MIKLQSELLCGHWLIGQPKKGGGGERRVITENGLHSHENLCTDYY